MGLLGDLTNWAKDIVESAGYLGVFFMIVLENVFPPIPSEAILPLAGFLAGEGRFWLPWVIVAATAGAVVGALILYYIAYAIGEHRVRWMVDRYGKWFAVSGKDLDTADAWFDRHGNMAVFLCRMVPIVRSIVSLPAGLRQMPLLPFILYTALGSGIWNSLLIILGWWLGDNWEDVGVVLDYIEKPLYVLVVLAVIFFIWYRKFSPAAKRAAAQKS